MTKVGDFRTRRKPLFIGQLTHSHSTYTLRSDAGDRETGMTTDPTRLLPLNPRDYLVLFVLTDGERHGYGIVKDVAEQTEGAVEMDPSNLYRSLKRLMGQGLVNESKRRHAGDNGERRRYYTITEFGRRVVAAEAARLAHLTEMARSRKLITRSGRSA